MKLPVSIFVIPTLTVGMLALAAPAAVCGTQTGAGAGMPVLVVPFELNSNKIYLEAHVGPEKRWLILDSGAPVTFLDRDLAVTLGLDPKGNSENAGLGESEAGIRAGDEIVAIDGRPASELSLEALRNRFVEVGKEREIAVRRGAQTLHAKITLRKLV